MDALIDSISRVILAVGTFPVVPAGQTRVTLTADQIAALTQRGTKTLNADGTVTVTLDPAVIQADQDAAAAAQADSDDRTAEQQWLTNIQNDITALTSDATALRDTTQTLTVAQLRAMLARTDDAVLRLDRGLTVLGRRLARRGL